MKTKDMYTLDDIKSWLFIDIETVSEAVTLDALRSVNGAKASLWSKRCEYLRRRYVECEKLDDAELYQLKAGLHAEFAKIVCVCVGIYQGDGKAQVVGFADDDEKKVMSQSLSTISRFKDNLLNARRTASPRLAGHNIKRFDVPVMCKRALANKMELPELLQVHNKKPWEMPFLDTAEIWSFGTWQESFTSLDLLANVLGLESSKTDMHGDQVQGIYWNAHPDRAAALAEIKKYCQNDVAVTMNVVLEWSGLPVVALDSIQRA
jgi:hypothetical protein